MSGEIPIVGRDASRGGENRDVIHLVSHLAGANGMAEDNLRLALQLQVSALQDG